MPRTINVTTSLASRASRLSGGLRVEALGPRPAQPLELWEFEACPFCRKVRAALCELDLEVRIFPCPRGGTRFRPAVKVRGGKTQFPYLVDPNTGVEMYESTDIVRYLWARYGAGAPPLRHRFGPLDTLSSVIAGTVRAGQGMRAKPSRAPGESLEMYGFEVGLYCRRVREELSSLELPYLLHNVAKGSPSREAFIARSGKMQVPYLVDPNTGVAMFESGDIVQYLRDTYML